MQSPVDESIVHISHSAFVLETRSSNWVFKILQDNSKLLEQVGMQKAILQMMDSSQFAIAKVQITKDIIY